jgi:tRNA threonylcarbamoyladenosine biosynthesis protein TsaB
LRAAVFDARRGEVYAAVYDDAGRLVGRETVVAPQRWLEALARRTTAPRALAAAIARIAWQSWQAGALADPASLDANYVRRSDAELLWKG